MSPEVGGLESKRVAIADRLPTLQALARRHDTGRRRSLLSDSASPRRMFWERTDRWTRIHASPRRAHRWNRPEDGGHPSPGERTDGHESPITHRLGTSLEPTRMIDGHPSPAITPRSANVSTSAVRDQEARSSVITSASSDVAASTSAPCVSSPNESRTMPAFSGRPSATRAGDGLLVPSAHAEPVER